MVAYPTRFAAAESHLRAAHLAPGDGEQRYLVPWVATASAAATTTGSTAAIATPAPRRRPGADRLAGEQLLGPSALEQARADRPTHVSIAAPRRRPGAGTRPAPRRRRRRSPGRHGHREAGSRRRPDPARQRDRRGRLLPAPGTARPRHLTLALPQAVGDLPPVGNQDLPGGGLQPAAQPERPCSTATSSTSTSTTGSPSPAPSTTTATVVLGVSSRTLKRSSRRSRHTHSWSNALG